MSSSKLTLIGINNYDPTIFENLTFPAGINKDIAVDEILMRSGEFEVLYPDINFLKLAIEHWGKKHYRTFEKWIDALSLEFDPLYNYDRYEEYTDSKIAQGSTKSDSNTVDNSVNTSNGTETSNDKANSTSLTHTGSTSSDTDTKSVSAYDASTYVPREQEITSNTSEQNGTGAAQNESEGSRTNSTNNAGFSTSKNEQNATSNNTEQSKHIAHLYGNIGVTTSTQMLEDFIRVERFNIYEQIADIFIDEFCILIY